MPPCASVGKGDSRQVSSTAPARTRSATSHSAAQPRKGRARTAGPAAPRHAAHLRQGGAQQGPRLRCVTCCRGHGLVGAPEDGQLNHVLHCVRQAEGMTRVGGSAGGTGACSRLHTAAGTHSKTLESVTSALHSCHSPPSARQAACVLACPSGLHAEGARRGWVRAAHRWLLASRAVECCRHVRQLSSACRRTPGCVRACVHAYKPCCSRAPANAMPLPIPTMFMTWVVRRDCAKGGRGNVQQARGRQAETCTR